MRRAIVLVFACLALIPATSRFAHAQDKKPNYSALPPDPPQADARTIDGIAARIEDDIITESEVQELSAFQKLVDGKAKSRADVIQELADQWIVRGEANTAKFPMPSNEDVDRAYQQFLKQFGSDEQFKQRCAGVGISEAAVRRILEQQLFLSRFIDYRFRPAAQIDEKQIETYYHDEFAPQLKKRGETVPPLEDVEETIREVLVQRDINQREVKWLDETRKQLNIDVLPGANPQ